MVSLSDMSCRNPDRIGLWGVCMHVCPCVHVCEGGMCGFFISLYVSCCQHYVCQHDMICLACGCSPLEPGSLSCQEIYLGSQASGRVLNTIHTGFLQKSQLLFPLLHVHFQCWGVAATPPGLRSWAASPLRGLFLPSGLFLDSLGGVAIAMASGSTGVGKVG